MAFAITFGTDACRNMCEGNICNGNCELTPVLLPELPLQEPEATPANMF